MSNPDITSEMAHFLQDNLLQFLMGATEDEIDTFIETLLPHISPAGVNRIYPLVSESFPDVRLNMLRDNPEKEGTNGD